MSSEGSPLAMILTLVGKLLLWTQPTGVHASATLVSLSLVTLKFVTSTSGANDEKKQNKGWGHDYYRAVTTLEAHWRLFFCYSYQLLHGLETPKVLVYRNHLCTKQNPVLHLHTDVSLCYAADDARILLDLSLFKKFAQTFVEYKFLPFPTCAKQFDTHLYFLAHGKFSQLFGMPI